MGSASGGQGDDGFEGLSSGSGAEADEITIAPAGREWWRDPGPVDRNAMTLQLVFCTRPVGHQSGSLLYGCEARRLSHESEEMASQYVAVRDRIAKNERFSQENNGPTLIKK